MGYGVARAEDAPRVGRVRRVLGAVLSLNLLVSAAKLIYGTITGSVAMVADGFHSLFDGASNVVGLVGVSVARRPADESHPYGHGKYETWASVGIGLLLAITAWSVGREAVLRLLAPTEGPRVDVGSFLVMGLTIAVNVGVTLTERRIGRRLKSEILLADASHTGSDVLVSLGVVAGLIAVRLGMPAADAVIALFVAGMIARAAWLVFRRADATFSDSARLEVENVCVAVLDVDGVLGCHDVRTRGSMSEVYVDLHVQVDPDRTLGEAHAIAEKVERHICEVFDRVRDVIVHIEPMDAYQADKTADQLGDIL